MLPTHTVTFLMTDIEGSTRLLQHLGDQYAGVLGDHSRLLRDAFAAFNGYVVDTQGDAFCAAFSRATDAVNAAVAAQRALYEYDQGPRTPHDGGRRRTDERRRVEDRR